MRNLILILALLVSMLAHAEAADRSSLPSPDVLVFSHMGGAVLWGADPAPNGWESDFTDNGFIFQLVRLEYVQSLGKHLDLMADLEFGPNEVALDSFQADFKDLPGGLTVSAGFFGTDLGLENTRSPARMTFLDSPLALQRTFGSRNHRTLGLQVAVDLPTPWDMRLAVSGMSALGGEEMRSWYGDADVPTDSITDLATHVSIRNSGTVGTVGLFLGLDAILGPNDSGRDNATNFFGGSLGITLNPRNVDSGFRLELESEWYLRRRQILGGALQDLAGWAWIQAHFLPSWSLAARYEGAAGVENDPLDPLDDSWRHRASLIVGWRVLEHARLRLQGQADLGGPHDDPAYSAVVHLEIGAALAGAED